MLLNEYVNESLPKGTSSRAAYHFSVGKRSVERLWHAAKLAIRNGVPVDVSSKMAKEIGRKKIQIDFETMKSIPYSRRINIRSTTKAMGMSKSKVHRRVKEGNIKAHSNATKVGLKLSTKISKLKHCLSMVDESLSPAKFHDMYNRIHIDEKWFYMSKTSQKYYLHPLGEEPLRTCHSKRFLPKFMFLSTVARPRFDAAGNAIFDGKIRIWAFIFMVAAQRTSKNRVTGTIEMRPIKSVTKIVNCSFLVEKLLRAIKQKWPHDGSTIFVQQDNAKPHISITDREFCEAVQQSGMDVQMCFQPANSHDLNTNDLGTFRSINKHQHVYALKTVLELVRGVEKAYDEYSPDLLNRIFLTLQTCMVEIMKRGGGNNYHIPHMNKERLFRLNQLPTCIECEDEVLNAGKEALQALVQKVNEARRLSN